MASCSITGYRFFNGTNASGWSSWSSTQKNAYAGYSTTNKKRCVYAIKVKTGSASGNLEGTSLTINVPLIKSNPGASEGTLYAEIYTEANDPTGGYSNSTPSGDPYNTGYSGSLDFSGLTTSGTIKTITINPDFELKASTTYVIVFGFSSSSQVVQIGYAGGNFSATWDYTVYGTYKVTVAVTDTGNSYTIKGQVTAGTGYTFDGATLYWTDDGTYPHESNYDNPNQYTHNITSTGSYSISRTISSSKHIIAVVCYNFKKANGEYVSEYTAYTESVYIEYVNRTLGSGGSISIVDNTDNTFSFKVTTPSSGTNNEIESTTIYYWLDDNDDDLKTTSATTSPNTTSTVKSSSTITKNTKVSAQMAVNYKYAVNGDKSIFYEADPKTITYRGPIGTPTIDAVDNGNNTFTITGTAASNGAGSNTATTKWYYSYSSTGASAVESAKDTAITPDFGGTSIASKNVYVQAKATAKYLNSKYATQTNWLGPYTVKQYVAPSVPGTVSINYTGNRLTNKVPWTFKWSAATATNASSSLKGYQFYLQRTAKGETAWSTVSGYSAKTTTSTSITISDPAALGFVAGDKVRARVRAYTVNGKDSKLTSGYADCSDTVTSAGVVQVKVGSEWKEGQVYIRVDGDWKEAEAVNVKTADGWKESQ